LVPNNLQNPSNKNTGCVSESGDFATPFFSGTATLGACRYCHFAANFKAF